MGRKFFLNGETVELLDLLRTLTNNLNQIADLMKGCLYHTLRGAMHERITAMGVVNVPHLVLLMQELGLLRKWGGGGATVWQVLDITFFESVMVPEWLERAQVCLQRHIDSTEQLRLLQQRVSELEVGSLEAQPVGEQTLAEIAAMTVELQETRAALAACQERIRILETELAQKPAFDADVALAAAIRRVRGG